jgi:hypothetical protein
VVASLKGGAVFIQKGEYHAFTFDDDRNGRPGCGR